MTKTNKVKAWLKATGLSNVLYLVIGIYATVKGFSQINFWVLISGAAFGIFIYLNFNAIKKMIKESKIVKKYNG